MDIAGIWLSQRNLRRRDQIPAMIAAIRRGEVLPKLTLSQDEDGIVQLQDGHHRLAAIWLSGRKELKEHEYVLLQQEQRRPRCWKINSLVNYP